MKKLGAALVSSLLPAVAFAQYTPSQGVSGLIAFARSLTNQILPLLIGVAVVYFIFKDILGDYASHWMTIFGVVLIAVIVFSPTGIAGALMSWVSGKPAAGKQPARSH